MKFILEYTDLPDRGLLEVWGSFVFPTYQRGEGEGPNSLLEEGERYKITIIPLLRVEDVSRKLEDTVLLSFPFLLNQELTAQIMCNVY